jgi:hypothetical protein
MLRLCDDIAPIAIGVMTVTDIPGRLCDNTVVYTDCGFLGKDQQV